MGEENNREGSKKWIALLAFALFSIIVIGIYIMVTSGPTTKEAALGLSYEAWVVFAYASGLTMIFLPCTLPLAFVIVPVAMNKSKKKGILMALLFGLGLTITIAVYTTLFGLLGQAFGFNRAAQAALLFGGIIAFLFGLQQLDIVPFELPEYSGGYPDFIDRQGDYLRSFLLGLFLGNAGIGCPNPLFWWMSIFIAASGSAAMGASLGVIHGIGRAVPLIFLAILGILGVNMMSGLSGKQELVEAISGFFLVPVSAFILTFGIFGMPWWEQSLAHKAWNALIAWIGLPSEAGFHGIQPNNLWAGVTGSAGTTLAWVFFLAVIVLPVLGYIWSGNGDNDES